MTFPSNLRTLSGVPVGSVTMHRSAAATGAASASHATTSSGSITRQSIYPIARSGCVIGCLLQTEFRRLRHFRLKLCPPRRYFTGKPHFRFAPDCFGQMRAQRCYDRFGAMRIAPAVGPLSIKIVRMVGDTGHFAASPSLTLSAVPEGQPYQCRRQVKCAIQFCGASQKTQSASNLARPSCAIVGPAIDQVIDTGGPAFEIQICRMAASENELVVSEQLIPRATSRRRSRYLAGDHVGRGGAKKQHHVGHMLGLHSLFDRLSIEHPVVVLLKPIAEHVVFRFRSHGAGTHCMTRTPWRPSSRASVLVNP
jgi:hypothetical protein